MRRSALVSLLVLAATGGCHKQEPTTPQAQPAAGAAVPADAGTVERGTAGKPMPAAAFQDPTDQPAKLADLKGKPVLVNLWATWCAPCVKELPTLDRLAAGSGERLHVLTISEDLEGRRVIQPFFAAHAFKALKPYGDKSNALMLQLKEAGLPTTILYGADGRELWRVHGDMDWTGAKAKALLAEAGV